MKQSGFSPKARWDRHIPQEDSGYDPAVLKESIQVLAFFGGAKIYPRMFIWNNKKYKIKRVTYHWQERCGQELISYFTVDTGLDLYQISFNNNSFGWRMDKRMEQEGD